MSSIQTFYEEAEKEGLGWQHMDGYIFGVQVTDVQRWAIYMVKVYEKRFGRTLEGKVFFKLSIDARIHWNRDGLQVL
jgi:hypothetical protein